MYAASTATARFLKGPFTVTVTGTGSGGSGTVESQSGLTPSIACAITNGDRRLNRLQGHRIRPTLRSGSPRRRLGGSTTTGWSAPCTNSGSGPCQFDVIQNRIITPTFSLSQSLTVTGSGEGSGTVRSQPVSPPAIDCTITAGSAS